MDKLLHEIKMLPGAQGVFVYIGNPDLVLADVPARYDEATMQQMGASLTRIFKMNDSCQLNVNAVEMLFDDTMLLVKHLGGDAALVVLCDPDANFPLINMTSGMVLDEMSRAVEAIKANPEAAIQKPPGITAESNVISFTQAQQTEPLKSVLPVFQDALARAIGPIAPILTKEITEKWLQEGACSAERFPELTDAFCQEIGDAPLEKAFRTEVGHLLGFG